MTTQSHKHGHPRAARRAIGAAGLLVILVALAACQMTPQGWGRIEGVVVDDHGRPVTDLTVAVATGSSPAITAFVSTGDDGAYQINVPAGTYRLRFGDEYWYSGTTNFDDSTPVTVLPGSEVTASATVNPQPPSSVSGTVRDDNGDAVAFADVSAIPVYDTTKVSATATTDSFGQYRISGLTGQFVLRFRASGHGERYSGGANTVATATVYDLHNGVSITGADVTLPNAIGAVRGRIINGSHPIANIMVVTINQDGTAGPWVFTGADGTFAIDQLDGSPIALAVTDPVQVYRDEAWGARTLDKSSLSFFTPQAGAVTDLGDNRIAACDPAVFGPGASLAGMDASGLQLMGCELQGADLTNVNFTGADLTGADLTGASLQGVVWSNTVCPDGTNSDLKGGTCAA